MTIDPATNFGIAEASTGYDASATSVVLETGTGSKFPQPSTDGAFNLVWWNFTDYPRPSDDPNVEIVRVTARTTDTLTVTRGQEGITATTKNTAGKTYKLQLGPTAKLISDIVAALATKEEASNKDIDGTFAADSDIKYPSQKAVKTYVDTGLGTKQDTLGYTAENTANRGAANGYAPLGADSKIPTSYLPALAITDTFVVSSQAAMLALDTQIGDVAVRTDLNKSYILAGSDPTILANWQELLTPTDTVLSVNGLTGAVTLTLGVSTIGTKDSVAASANGASISGTTLYMQSASTTVPGLVNNSDQSFSGKKIFANTLIDSASNDINVSSVLTIANTANSANGITPTSGRFLTQVTDSFLHTGDFFIGSFSGSSYTGTNTLDVTIGGYSEVQNESSGTISFAAGLSGRVGNISSGTITNAFGLLIDIENLAGGSISTGYGVKINSLGATTNYGFYNDIAGSMDRFVRVGIGIDPAAALHVTETSGSGTQLPLILATGASHTALTASTEHTEINFNLSSTKQFATGALTILRAMRIQAPIYSFVGASTIQSAATVSIGGAPIKGTNATLSNTIGLWIQSNNVVGAGEAAGLFVEAPTGGTLNYAAVFGPAGTASVRFNSTSTVALQFQNGNGTEINFIGTGNGTVTQSNLNSELDFATNGGGMYWSTNLFTNIAFNIQSNKMFIGANTAATALLHLAAGTAAANTAPLKFTTGTVTTTAVAGQMEYNNTFHLTNSDGTRRHVILAPNATKVTAGVPYLNDGYLLINVAGTDFKVMTTA